MVYGRIFAIFNSIKKNMKLSEFLVTEIVKHDQTHSYYKIYYRSIV